MPPYVLAPGGGVEVLDAPPGLPLGVMADFAHSSARLTLPAGSALFLYTDGVTEAENAEAQQFSKERLEASLQAAASGSAPEVLAAVVRAVRSFTGDTPPSDDLTALVLRFRGRG
jgi:sigma-B regulation protein RsbU (phosphoserine phosphatase)